MLETDKQVFVKRVKEFFARVTYKPGSYFIPFESLEGVGFRFAINVTDMSKPERKGMIGRGGIFKYKELNLHKKDLDGFLSREVRRIVHSGEIHEADEWLKIDGVATFDPHKGDH